MFEVEKVVFDLMQIFNLVLPVNESGRYRPK